MVTSSFCRCLLPSTIMNINKRKKHFCYCCWRSYITECILSSGLAQENPNVAGMLTELCVTELEDAASDTEAMRSVPQPVVQESSHPYTDDVTLTGVVKIPGKNWGGIMLLGK